MNLELLSLPFIGAFIGYFTNYVAIKMLFLPRKPYYIFGFKVPFTPGLIPKKRDELVDKIAEVVANRVINKKDIVRYIYKKKNRQFLYDFAQRTLNSFLSRKVSSLNLNKKRIQNHIEAFLDANLDSIIREKLKNVQLDIDYFVFNALSSIDTDIRLSDILPKETEKAIEKLSFRLATEALNRLSETVDTPEVRTLIRKKLIEAIERYATESNTITATFLSFIAPLVEDNERIINTIVLEVQSLLKDEVIRTKTAQNVQKAIDNQILNRKLEEIVLSLNLGSLNDVKRKIADEVARLAERINLKERIIDNAIKSVDKHSLATQLTEILFNFLETHTFADIVEKLKPELLSKLPSMAVNSLLYVIKKESEMIFSFDIAQLARQKLQKLDIAEIEDVVLNISKDQFTHINIFGGILGFLIGIIEIAISSL